MKILHLTLKKKWFDMIASGEKKEEYREVKEYWNKRFKGKEYTHVKFRNGYSKDAPTLTLKLHGIKIDLGHSKWGAPNEPVYCLLLGEIDECTVCDSIGDNRHNKEVCQLCGCSE